LLARPKIGLKHSFVSPSMKKGANYAVRQKISGGINK